LEGGNVRDSDHHGVLWVAEQQAVTGLEFELVTTRNIDRQQQRPSTNPRSVGAVEVFVP
jgi:hypothetical protein